MGKVYTLFQTIKDAKTIPSGAAHTYMRYPGMGSSITLKALCISKVLFGSQYRTLCPLSGVSQINW